MKNIAFILSGILVTICAELCAQDSLPAIKDRDGNIYAVKNMPDNKIWMTDNLATLLPGSYCYDNNDRNCRQYGRLYTWRSAQEGCRLLGNGWRLPANNEWQTLAKAYGGILHDSDDSGRAAYRAFIPGGRSGLNIKLGGGRLPDGDGYARINAHGFYWTITETDTAHAWLYNFGTGLKLINRHNDTEKRRAVSVRCIKD